MKYYKILMDKVFIGVVHSGAFLRESTNGQRLFCSDEERGQYVMYKGTLYRDYWMVPVTGNREFLQAEIVKIDEETYDALKEAIKNNEIIEEEEEEELPVIEIPVEENPTLEYVRSSKLRQMSNVCRQTIENGFDLELRGETHHFSLDTQDQLNLISLSAMAQQQEYIPYHADGEACIFYTAEEMNSIVAAATSFKIYHTTYYNTLKSYINSLESIEAISAIEYGTEIPLKYQSDVFKALQA